MLKWLIGLLASVSSVFISGTNKPNVAPPLNTAIIAYQETYYAPVVADLGNFPRAKSSMVTIDDQEIVIKKEVKVTPPAAPIPIPTPSTPPPVTPPPAPVSESYLTDIDPTSNWYMPIIFRGNSASDGTSITLPERTFNRDLWRIEVLAYWDPGKSSGAPVENDYFKLEVYEKGTNKLIYTMTSGSDESIHKFQAFKKPGTYYFKIFLKNPSQYEVTFTFSGNAVQ